MSAEVQVDLPKGVVKRIVKEKLNAVADSGKDVQINKDALLAFAESAKVFINYVTAAASDVCKEKKRATLTANDVFQGLEELEFQELIPGLQEAYDAYKQSTKEKKEKKAETIRKRKSVAQAVDGAVDTAAQQDTSAAAAAAMPATGQPAAPAAGGPDEGLAADVAEAVEVEEEVMEDVDVADAAADEDEAGDME